MNKSTRNAQRLASKEDHVAQLTAKNILIVIFSFQVALLGSIGLEKLELGIPILRQVVGFVYLTFVPGFLILRLFNVSNNNEINLEFFLYSVGLSLFFLMITGFSMNYLYRLIGITKPISEIPLIITISIIIFVLSLLWYLRDFSVTFSFSINKLSPFSPIVLFSLLLPLLAITGASTLRFYSNNTILLFLLAVISLLPLLVAFNYLHDAKYYPLIIWSVSSSLLFHYGLVNPTFLDENIITGLVARRGFWDPSIPTSQASLLAGPVVLPIFSKICGISILWTLRIIYPLLYSLTPLALYLIFKKQFGDKKIAFMSSYLFMTIFSFYVILSTCVRTGMAEFFITLLTLLIISRDWTAKMTLLSVVFAFSLVTSHYGTSYLFMFALIFACFVSFLFKKLGYNWEINMCNFSLLYVILCLSWYMYTAKSFNFNILPDFATHIISTLQEEGIGAESYTAMILRKAAPSLSIEITKLLSLLITFLSVIGVLTTLYTHLLKAKRKLNSTYLLFSIVFLGIQTATFLPITGFNIARVYHISLIFLSPFALVGFLNIFRAFWKITGESLNLRLEEVTLKSFSILLCILFIFNSGLFAEIVTKGEDYAPSVLISKKRLSEEGNINGKIYLYKKLGPSICDIQSGKWLAKKAKKEEKIFVDILGWQDRLRYLPEFHIMNGTYERMPKFIYILKPNKSLSRGYVVLFEYNIMEKKIIIKSEGFGYFVVSPLPTALKQGNKIYTNNRSKIYYLC